ncbi:hypothetical protein FHS33_006649 [Streptomyces calvus]|uniref:Uncharacterized protein n=1 Tax=Streptomyces calvus TaxID=67282 RepID=A0AA40SKH2_9ACTN|nr:hypothetical protein [Streptomyces calvus]GGP84106.1 hypothetical protein GCM10010247_66850 [Streptomyces calvus]
MTHRPAVFAALLGLTRAGSALGDYWVNAAKVVSTFPGVSVPSTKLMFRANCGPGQWCRGRRESTYRTEVHPCRWQLADRWCLMNPTRDAEASHRVSYARCGRRSVKIAPDSA